MKRNCNALVINVLYSVKSEVLSVFVSCFIPEYDAVFHALKLQKRIVISPVSPNFGRVTRPHTPHFSALYPPKLHLCTLVPMPGTPFPHTPKHHSGYPISPFGVSHFAIWGILRRVYAPILAPFYPLFALISSHFRGKNGRQNVCLSPQLSGNQTTKSLLQCPHAG